VKEHGLADRWRGPQEGAIMPRDEALQLDHQVCFPLYAASLALVRAYRPLLEPLQLTYPQYLVMLVLWERQRTTLRDLRARLHLDSGTLSPLLKRLEGAGLLRRSRSATDERVVQVELTAQGRALKERAREIPEEIFCRISLPVDELLSLRAGLLRMLGDFGAQDALPPRPAAAELRVG
jgi:DNA-binding MarR family transcriptional regulator